MECREYGPEASAAMFQGCEHGPHHEIRLGNGRNRQSGYTHGRAGAGQRAGKSKKDLQYSHIHCYTPLSKAIRFSGMQEAVSSD